ncbi:hypothetical protein [Rhizosphaericola mali]|uniref:Uncharacterized protein n=1 Tax=Rhizosphaericola mali TaxID=2545455 RepID=A0A5P2G2C5_9BACT|nr:hypothetical protein [Rhizosphaericola mali]QES88868.1 hypothetical protein E0W69_009440 [Rhizosphaericola mali]
MNTIQIDIYNINLEEAAKVKSKAALLKDQRFFHNHTGKERQDLVEQLWQKVNPTVEETTPEIVKPETKQENGTESIAESNTEPEQI